MSGARLRRVFGRAARPAPRVLAASAGLGALVALGQAPLGWWWLALPAFAGVLALIARQGTTGKAAWAGWAAGAGFGAAAMFWIVEPFLVDAARYGWMAPFALLLLAAGMGLFWAFAAALGLQAAGQRRGLRLLALAFGFAASDLLRSYIFTGLPWALLGHAFIGTPLMQLAALAGPVGLSLAFTLPAAALAAVVTPAAGGQNRLMRAVPVVVMAAALVGGWGWGAARRDAPAPVPARDVVLRLVQPNATQALKWQRDYALAFFYRQLDLTAAPAARRPDLIIWPETSVPFLLDAPGAGLEMIVEAAAGVPVALGIQRSEGARYFNSLVVLGPKGEVSALYDKFHLTPFGEYIPYGDAFARLGITAFAARLGNGFTAGPGAAVLDLGGLGRVQPLICYEAVFPQDLRAAPERPDWLMQVTNDSWFGALAGPQQHLAQAQLRAVETGLPLARAANTGVSAMIDARGRVLATLPLNTEGFLDVSLPAALPATPYARSGDGPIFAMIVALLALIAARARLPIDRTRAHA
ncbi:MAG: apolipoprotein N-acyltransferase [Phaeovulum sp.]|uniref:apolipoprotein N-acyltransferase n=1 Tax=Phaeovulum sp. TaxID=2934796 RepID=UPI002734DAE8|nr:apolipoprotein N-acyltransferase [Phaeovulum sp.]MDP3862331.1 apolipoprotein N-acyltransferase [Phaeovulum sp.]